jgi:phospholipid/cholesterol/gamma-HCH transport system permease protein
MIFFNQFGHYILFLNQVFKKPDRWKMFFKSFFKEFYSMGNDSFQIVSIISMFIGGVTVIQFGYQLSGTLAPANLLGRIVRDANILEFSPTIIGLVMAGKIGSSIAGEIGTMKVSEQIDALEIMGVNSANYVVLPKIISSIITMPIITIYSITLSIAGGAISTELSGVVSMQTYIDGLLWDFDGYNVFFSLVKAFVFGFVISSISSFHGYNTSGGALEVGESSTKSVVQSCIAIIFFDYTLAQLMLYR